MASRTAAPRRARSRSRRRPGPVEAARGTGPVLDRRAAGGRPLPQADPRHAHRRHCRRAVRLTFGYTLNIAAKVTLTFQRRIAGHRVRKLRGSISQTGAAGAHTLVWRGRIGGHRIGQGRYVLTATPSGGKPRRVGSRSAPDDPPGAPGPPQRRGTNCTIRCAGLRRRDQSQAQERAPWLDLDADAAHMGPDREVLPADGQADREGRGDPERDGVRPPAYPRPEPAGPGAAGRPRPPGP